jgi:hypothetical protein
MSDWRSGVEKAAAEHEKGEAQHWTTKRTTARKHGLTVAELENWTKRFFLGAENALRARPKDEEALREEQIKKLKQKIGKMVMDINILREAAKRHPPMPGTPEE